MKSNQRIFALLLAGFFLSAQIMPFGISTAVAHDGIPHTPTDPHTPTIPVPEQTPSTPSTTPDHPHDDHDSPLTPPTDPHANDPKVVQDEHAALMNLVALEAVTHRMSENCRTECRWSDTSSWEAGVIPTTDANIHIQEGMNVLVDTVDRTTYRTIRVDGLLDFKTDINTGLKVDTLVVTALGHLRMGSEENPVEAGVEAKIIVADRGEIDLNWDPREVGRGVLSHGRITMHGEAKAAQAALARTPVKKDKQLVLASVPMNWKVGDLLVLAGVSASKDEDDQLMITAIDGNTVSVVGLDAAGKIVKNWKGLDFNYYLTEGTAETFVINVSRNVVIESENAGQLNTPTDMGINKRRGHVMIMHSGVSKTNIAFAGFYGLGRTDKRTRLENAEFDANGVRKPDTGHNIEGRYALHFHRGGPGNAPAHIQGVAIVDSPGLGLVNHSSNVEVENTVAYHIVGSAFFTEAGDEKGHFINCSAIRITGSGDGNRDSMAGVELNPISDFGHGGHGFWLQSGFKLSNVKVAGAKSAGIIFFTEPLTQKGLGTTVIKGANVDPAISLGRQTLGVGEIPIDLDGALIFASGMGVDTKFHQLDSKHSVRSQIKNVTMVNNKLGMDIDYTRNTDLKNLVIIGYPSKVSTVGINRNGVTNSILYENLTVKYFDIGIMIPVNGKNIVRGGVYQNVEDIHVTTLEDINRTVDIEGDIQFLDLTADQLDGRKKYEIYLQTTLNFMDNDITHLFEADVIKLGTVRYHGKQIYFYEQAYDFVPFPKATAAAYVPAEFIDKTNTQLWEEFGLAIGGAVAPVSAVRVDNIHALIGDPTLYPPSVYAITGKYTNQLQKYKLSYDIYRANGKKQVKVPGFLTLREGWNLYTFFVDGFKRTLMIFGDVTPPTFVPSSKTPLAIHPDELDQKFTITGTVTDNSTGREAFTKNFSGADLVKLPRLVGADGKEFVELKFTIKDKAGNKTEVIFKLVLDPSLPTTAAQVRKNLPARKVPKVLMLLLGFKEDRLLQDLLTLPLAA